MQNDECRMQNKRRSSRFHSSFCIHHSAFTLLELLVTLTIIVVLVGILVPMITKSVGKAHRIRLAGDLQTISTALEAYRADFGDYPRAQYAANVNGDASHPNPPTGAEVLCRALIGPAPATDPNAASNPPILAQDGADGPGFRTRGVNGRVYGPYLAADKFKVVSLYSSSTNTTPVLTSSNQPVAGSAAAAAGNPFYPLTAVILDIDGNPILYFPSRPTKPDIEGGATHLNQGYVGSVSNPPSTLTPTPPTGTQFSLFNTDDGWLYMHYFFHDGQCVWRSSADSTEMASGKMDSSTLGFKRIAIMLGDYDASNPAATTNCDGSIDEAGEHAVTEPFVLWCAGQDGRFGPDALSADQSQYLAPTDRIMAKLDDVTNVQ